jgi:hypothetical protein
MRIRQIKPAFWSDAVLAELTPGERLTFIGLWMVADDGGWLRYDPAQIANELYGYEPRRRRERAVAADVEALAGAGRVAVYECGHALVLHLTEHQRMTGEGKRVLTIEREHGLCPAIPADSRGFPANRDTVRNGNGKERNGTSRARSGDSREAAEDAR